MNVVANLTVILAMLGSSPASTREAIDLSSMKGWTVSQLQQVFPLEALENPNWAAGESISLKNWQGWSKIVFNFNGAGRLSGVDIFFDQGLGPNQAVKLCQSKLNLALANNKRVEAPMMLAYRGLSGAIRTVNFFNEQDRFAWEDQVDHIYLQFDIGWSD